LKSSDSRLRQALALAALTVLTSCSASDSPSRLDRIQDRGFVTCGVWTGIAGFATADEDGHYQGMDVEVCRAVAAAIFGSPENVAYVRAENVQQIEDDEDLDIISRRITWSLTRAASNNLMFGPVIFYDGQGFLVPRASGIESVDDLAGKSVCVQTVERHAATLAAFALERGLDISSVPIDTDEEAQTALQSGRCAAFSADVSWLGSAKLKFSGTPDDYVIFPDLISKEPLAPLVRMGDDQFFEIVRWSVFAMIAAEEFGINSKNVEAAREARDPEILRLLGVVPGNGAVLGLDEDWASNIIKTVGNYGEIYARNVGADSAINLDRGLNKLWTDGGLMFAPRLR